MSFPRRKRLHPRLSLLSLEDRVTPAVNTWQTPGGGDWGNAANWSLTHVPTSTEDAVITGLTTGASITHNSGTDFVHSVTLGTNFAINGGALTIGGDLVIQPTYKITDNATLNFSLGSTVSFSYLPTSPIIVNSGGLLTATNTIFTGYNAGNQTQILVNSGGHFTSSNSTYTFIKVYWDYGSNLGASDLSGNSFLAPVSVAQVGVQHLSNNAQFVEIDILGGSVPGGQTLNLNQIGTNPSLKYKLAGNFTVSPGATMNVAANVNFEIPAAWTLTDSGMVTFNTNAQVKFDYDPTSPIVVTNSGTLNSITTTWTGYNAGNTSQILVNSGGHFTSSNSSYTFIEVYWDYGSNLGASDLSGNSFLAKVSLPQAGVQHLSNNAQFVEIDILGGSVPGGQTLNLNQIGTNPSLKYELAGNFTVSPGATMNVAAGVKFEIPASWALTDSGTVTFNVNAQVKFDYGPTSPIVVTNGGTLNAINTTFTGYNAGNQTQILVNSGGHFTSSNSTYTFIKVYWDNGSILGAADLSGNSFFASVSIPRVGVQYLSNNLQFADINILAGSVPSGQTLALNAIGTNPASLRYVFVGNFTVSPGGTMTVAPGVKVAIDPSMMLTDSGTVTFGSGAQVSFSYAPTTPILVTNGGVLNADTTIFTGYNAGSLTQIYVSSGGRIKASTCTFTFIQLYLDNGAILKKTDLLGNSFTQSVFVPAINAVLLSNNLTFTDVVILPGSLSNGQVATLGPLGQSGTQRYIFNATTGNFTVQAGATLTIQPEAKVVALETTGTTFGLVVNGILNIADASLTHSSTFGSSTIQVGPGGHMTATHSTLAWSKINLTSGAAADFQFDSFTTKLTINSGTAINIFNNDFSSNGANGVIAAGNPSATINMQNNYWGTDPSAIPGMIQDHVDFPATLPTISYTPFLTTPPFPFFNPTSLPLNVAGVSGNQAISAVGGTGPATNFTVSSGALPAGVTLSGSGVVSGTPASVGSYVFVISADDVISGNPVTVNQLYWLVVKQPEISFNPTTLPSTRIGNAYNQTLSASGGTAPYTQFVVSAGTLPNGLTLSTGGLISGTPTVDGLFSFTVTAQDSSTGPNAPYVGAQEYTICVDDTPPYVGFVNDGLGADIDFQVSISALSANWNDFGDLSSGIASYQWGIGTTPGSLDVLAFTNVGTATSASNTSLTLTTGALYYVSVKALDNSGNASTTVTSDGLIVDNSAPAAGSVNDGLGADIDTQVSLTTISANWLAFGESASGIASYEWAIGLSPGGITVQGYTDVGNTLTATATGLSLSEDSKYYVSVRATDNVGNTGMPGSSDGVTIVPAAPTITNYSTDTGVVGDGITKDNTPTLSGTAKALSTVKIYNNGTYLDQVVAGAAGNWQYTTAALADGVQVFTATATNLTGNTSPVSDPLDITIDTAAPSVTINLAGGQSDPTNVGPIMFAVHFGKPVTGFSGADVDLSGSNVGTLVANVSGSGSDYIVTVTGMNGAGNVVATIPADGATDDAGNGNTVSTSSSVAFDNVPPTVTINPAAGQANPALTAPVVFQVTFSKPVTGFTAADVDLTTSTVNGGSPTAHVAGAGMNYTVTVDGMYGVGTIVALISVGAAVDALGNPSASPTGTAVVDFNSAGQLQFTASAFNTTEGVGLNTNTVSLTVSRINGSDGAVSVSYATSDGTATGTDYVSASNTLNWDIGDTADKTIIVTIPADDSLSEGDENFHVTLSTPLNGATLGAQSAATVTIAKNGPLGSGAPFEDSDHDQVTLKLTGDGTLKYYLTDGKGPISQIDLTGTNASKSVLSVAVKKQNGGDGRVRIGAIDGGAMKTLSLAKADLVGDGIDMSGFLGSLTIGAISSGADIALAGGPPKPTLSTKITAGVIGDNTDITVSGAPLGSLTAISVGVGSISAPSVGTINIKGKAKAGLNPAIPGDFKSNLTIAGTGLTAPAPALKKLRVAGAVSGSTIIVGTGTGTGFVGDVGSVTVGSFVNSKLFAGYNGVAPFNLASTVGTFTVTGTTDAFAHSDVFATNFNTVTLASFDQSNTGPQFGFNYRNTMKKLTVKKPSFTYDGSTDQSSGNFHVKKI